MFRYYDDDVKEKSNSSSSCEISGSRGVGGGDGICHTYIWYTTGTLDEKAQRTTGINNMHKYQ